MAAAAAAARLGQPDILTPYGLRDYRPRTRILQLCLPSGRDLAVRQLDRLAGLRAYGEHEVADRIRDGVLEALAKLGRYPELYGVTRPARWNQSLSPTACRPGPSAPPPRLPIRDAPGPPAINLRKPPVQAWGIAGGRH